MKKLVKRSDKIPFYGINQSDGSVKYYKMLGFSEISVSKNPKEYSRQYITDEFERTDVVGYSPSISFSFDRYTDDIVHNDIVGIFDKEIIGSDAVRNIIIVDKTECVGTGCKAVKRSFSVIPDSEGDSTDAYTYSGNFKCKGKSQSGTAFIEGGNKATFYKNVSSETFDEMTSASFDSYRDNHLSSGGNYRTSYLSLTSGGREGKCIYMPSIAMNYDRLKFCDMFGKRIFTNDDIGRKFRISISVKSNKNTYVNAGIFSVEGTYRTDPCSFGQKYLPAYTWVSIQFDYTVTINTLEATMIGIDQRTEYGSFASALWIDDIYVYETDRTSSSAVLMSVAINEDEVILSTSTDSDESVMAINAEQTDTVDETSDITLQEQTANETTLTEGEIENGENTNEADAV